MAQLNVGLRFLLEVAGVTAVAYWGYGATTGIGRWILAISTPIALIAVWAVVVAPGASNSIPQDVRILIGTALLLGAAGLLALAGQGAAATVLAALVVLNTVGMFVLRDRG